MIMKMRACHPDMTQFQIMTVRDHVDIHAKRFGAIIRRLRLQRGLQIQTLARRADLSRQHLSLLERGMNVPSIETIFNLAEILHVRPSEIIAEMETDPNPPPAAP